MGPVLDEENSLLASGLVLVQAFYTAAELKDVEKMIEIADRWMILSKMLGGEQLEEEEEFPSVKTTTIGFTALTDFMENNNDNSPEGDDQSPSGT